jgi:hypothetical protein
MFVPLEDLNEAVRCACDERPEDGIYQATIIQARIGYSKAGNRQIIWDLEFMNRQTKKPYQCQKYHSLESPWIDYVVRDLKKFRITLDHIQELPQVLMELTGSTVRIEYNQDGDWYNLRFISLICKRSDPECCL